MGKYDLVVAAVGIGAVAIFGYFGFKKIQELLGGLKLPSILPTLPDIPIIDEVTLPEILIPTVEEGGVVIPSVADIPSTILNIPSAITPTVEGQPFFYSPTLSWINEGIQNLLNPPPTPTPSMPEPTFEEVMAKGLVTEETAQFLPKTPTLPDTLDHMKATLENGRYIPSGRY